jgi:hypothetical protein
MPAERAYIVEMAKKQIAEWEAEKAKRIAQGYGAIWTPREIEMAEALVGMAGSAEDDKTRTVKIHVGTSVLSRDLVWCECNRGLSLHGNWVYCPNCGGKIDQESYRAALEEAAKNGIVHYYRDPEDVEVMIALTNERDRLKTTLDEVKAELTKWISVCGNC